VVRNHAGRAPLARITGLTAHRGAHRATKLTISARSGRLPAGAQLAFSWLVKGAKHGTVAHTQLARGGTRSATYVFAAPRAGRYTLAANVSVLLPNGITASASARRLRFRA
jgi:hypothetical protein